MIFKISENEELQVLFDTPHLKRGVTRAEKNDGNVYVPFGVIQIVRGDDKLIDSRSVYNPQKMTLEQRTKIINHCEKMARKYCKEKGKIIAPIAAYKNDPSGVADSALGHATHHRNGTWSYFGYRNKK